MFVFCSSINYDIIYLGIYSFPFLNMVIGMIDISIKCMEPLEYICCYLLSLKVIRLMMSEFLITEIGPLRGPFSFQIGKKRYSMEKNNVLLYF